MGKALGIVAFAMPVLLVYWVKQGEYALAADVFGVITHQSTQMNRWTSAWALYQLSIEEAKSAMSAERWENSLNTGEKFDMLNGAQALLAKL